MMTELNARCGENISVSRFARFIVGENAETRSRVRDEDLPHQTRRGSPDSRRGFNSGLDPASAANRFAPGLISRIDL